MQMNFDPLPSSPLLPLAFAVVTVAVLTGGALWGASRIDKRGYDRAKAEDLAMVQAQKLEASHLLGTLTASAAKVQADLSDKITALEIEREKLQRQNSAALLAHSNGPSLHYTAQAVGCGAGGGGATAAPGSTASDPGTADFELPGPIGRDLWQLAGDAESLSIDYRVLYAYVHDPKLVCSLIE